MNYLTVMGIPIATFIFFSAVIILVPLLMICWANHLWELRINKLIEKSIRDFRSRFFDDGQSERYVVRWIELDSSIDFYHAKRLNYGQPKGKWFNSSCEAERFARKHGVTVDQRKYIKLIPAEVPIEIANK
jgi:hypothetical protein